MTSFCVGQVTFLSSRPTSFKKTTGVVISDYSIKCRLTCKEEGGKIRIATRN